MTKLLDPFQQFSSIATLAQTSFKRGKHSLTLANSNFAPSRSWMSAVRTIANRSSPWCLQNVTLSSFDTLACAVAAFGTFFRRFDGLAINGSRTRFGSRHSPGVRPAESSYSSLSMCRLAQHALLTARANEIENCIQDFTQIDSPFFAQELYWQEGRAEVISILC